MMQTSSISNLSSISTCNRMIYSQIKKMPKMLQDSGNAYSLEVIPGEHSYITNKNKNNKVKVALKCCLAGPSILQHGLTTTAISALNTSVQWHASTATKSIHPVLPPASAPLSPQNHKHFPWCFTTEPAKRWERNSRQDFNVFGKPQPVSRIILICALAPSGHFHSK